MKKLLSLLTVTAMMAFAVVSVHAEDTEVTTNTGAEATVTKTNDSSFSVLIPKAIDLGTATEKEFTVQAKGNIAPTQTLSVTVEETIAMTRSDDVSYSGSATAELADASWTGNALTSDYSSKNGTVTFEETKAGSYTGTAEFTVTLQ